MGLAMRSDSLSIVDDEIPVELLSHLLLPLNRQWCGSDDEDAFSTFTGDEFLYDDASFNGLPETDLVTDEVPMVVRIQYLVGRLHLIGFYLDAIVRQRQEAVVSIRKVKTGRSFSKVVLDGIVDLLRRETVYDRVDLLDMGQSTRKFA